MKAVISEKVSGIEFFRVNNGANGNPRYVVHYSHIPINEDVPVFNQYKEALNKARQIGGRKYTAKWFGGGIVFQAHLLHELAAAIHGL